MTSKSTYHPWAFYTITFFVTWTAWFFAAYLSGHAFIEPMFSSLLLIGLVAPFITALLLILLTGDRMMQRDFASKLFNLKRIRWSTIPEMIMIVPLALIISVFISTLFGESLNQLHLSGSFSFIAGVFPVLIILLLAASFEELGWRGYAMESLQIRLSYFSATLIFSLLWAFWHLPLFFIKGYYQYNLLQENVWFALNFFAGVVPIAFIIGWYYRKNRESIPAAIFFHFVINLSQEAFQVTNTTKCIETLVLGVIAAWIVYSHQEVYFNQKENS